MSSSFAARASTIPLRLTDDERGLLRVLEGALTVSEYTDKVDIFSYRANKASCIEQQLGSMLAVLSGMLVAAKGRQGQQLVMDRALSENPELFCAIFEVGRRYKIMNPDKMRSSYGKLMFLLQDAQMPEIRDSIGFRVVRAVHTVDTELEDLGCAELLDDEALPDAVAPVSPGETPECKQRATAELLARYGGGNAAVAGRLERVLLSLSDDESLTAAHVGPVEEMMSLLKLHFDTSAPEKGSSLAISAGRNGARLSHSHATQYAYVSQSLMLWREILSSTPPLRPLANRRACACFMWNVHVHHVHAHARCRPRCMRARRPQTWHRCGRWRRPTSSRAAATGCGTRGRGCTASSPPRTSAVSCLACWAGCRRRWLAAGSAHRPCTWGTTTCPTHWCGSTSTRRYRGSSRRSSRRALCMCMRDHRGAPCACACGREGMWACAHGHAGMDASRRPPRCLAQASACASERPLDA